MQDLVWGSTLSSNSDSPTSQGPGVANLATPAAGTLVVTNLPSVAVTGLVYAEISDGPNKEIISFTGITGTLGAAGSLTGVSRALGGTLQLNHNAGTTIKATQPSALVIQSELNRDVLNINMRNNGTGTLTAAVVVGQIASIKVPYACEITDVDLVSQNNVSGSAVIDIQVGTTTYNASGGVSSVGTGTAPTLTTAIANAPVTPAGNTWSGPIAVPAGTYIYAKVTSVTSISDLRVEVGVSPN